MARSSLTKLTRIAGASMPALRLGRAAPRLPLRQSARRPSPILRTVAVPRFFSSTSHSCQGILREDTEEPKPKQPAPTAVELAPANITDAQYHQIANEYLETVLTKFEELQDERDDVDVEYSDGVLTIAMGPQSGTYVINKQPPNRQIWLSSPETGPKRYDWVIIGDGQGDKEGTATGDWVYLRDRSTLTRVLRDELGVDLGLPVNSFSDK